MSRRSPRRSRKSAMRQASNVILCAKRPSAKSASSVTVGPSPPALCSVNRIGTRSMSAARSRRRALATAAAPSSIAGIRRCWKSIISSADRSRSIVSILNPLLWSYYQYMVTLFGEIHKGSRSNQSLVHVPDVSGEFPLIVNLAPDDDVLSDDLLRRIALRLEAECADFARRIRPERLHIDSGQLGVAELLHRAVPEALDGLPAVNHLAAGWKDVGILGVQLGQGMRIALEGCGPLVAQFLDHRLVLGSGT